jgi:hypothetical protein
VGLGGMWNNEEKMDFMHLQKEDQTARDGKSGIERIRLFFET